MTKIEFENLLLKNEVKKVDFKDNISFDEYKEKLAKNFAAFANSKDGGIIIIGLKDGIPPGRIGISDENLASFDSTKMSNYLIHYLDPMPQFELEVIEFENLKYLIIRIFEFSEIPIVLKKDLKKDNKDLARVGDILYRNESRESKRICSSNDMHDLIQRAVFKKSEKFLKGIENLINNKTENKEFDSTQIIVELLPDFEKRLGDFGFVNDPKYYWKLQIVPFPLLDNPQEYNKLKNLMNKCIIDSISTGNTSYPAFYNFQEDIRNRSKYIELSQDHQFWQLSNKGAFGHCVVDWTELNPTTQTFNFKSSPNRPIFQELIIRRIHWMILFIKKLMENLGNEKVYFKIDLVNIKNRYLGKIETHESYENYTSYEESYKYENIISLSKFIASWESIVADIIYEIFSLFQMNNLSREGLLLKIKSIEK